jgi:histidinol-phosphate aminotransferase
MLGYYYPREHTKGMFMSIDFQQLPHAGIRNLVPYKPGKSIEELANEKGITDIIKMASNENPLGCSPLALKALHSIPSHRVSSYPSPHNHPLMSKLAKHLNISTEQLFLSNGSDYIFSILLNCFALHRNKHILTHEYAFSTYEIQAHTLNIPVCITPVNMYWEVKIDSLISACNAYTALIFIANPNNPTGLLIPQEEIKRLLEHIPPETILVLDEAYFEYAEDEVSCNSIDWLREHPNLVITRTFSKLYGLAGLRLGYAIAHPSIIALLGRAQLPFAVNQAALHAAFTALDDRQFVMDSLKNNQLGLAKIRQGFDALQLHYLPSFCNFLTFNSKADGMKLYDYLLEQGIIIRPLHPYKMNEYLRVTVGTEEQNTRFLSALNDYYV